MRAMINITADKQERKAKNEQGMEANEAFIHVLVYSKHFPHNMTVRGGDIWHLGSIMARIYR